MLVFLFNKHSCACVSELLIFSVITCNGRYYIIQYLIKEYSEGCRLAGSLATNGIKGLVRRARASEKVLSPSYSREEADLCCSHGNRRKLVSSESDELLSHCCRIQVSLRKLLRETKLWEGLTVCWLEASALWGVRELSTTTVRPAGATRARLE